MLWAVIGTDVETGLHHEDRFAILQRLDVPGDEGASVADAIHEERGFLIWVSPGYEVSVDGVHAKFRAHGAGCRHQALRSHLAAKRAP